MTRTPPTTPPTHQTVTNGSTVAIVAAMPAHASLGGWSWRASLRMTIFVALAFGCVLFAIWATGKRPPTWVFVLPFAIASSVMFIRFLLVPNRWRVAAAAEARREPAGTWVAAIGEATGATGTLEALSSVEARWKRLLERPERPRAIIDERLQPGLAAIELRPELLEPEPIQQSRRSILVPAIMFAWCALMNIKWVNPSGSWWIVGIYGVLCVVFVLRIPKVRDQIPALRDTGRDLVAGPGWLRDKRNRRWTVLDSFAIVQRTRRGKKRPGVWFRFIGPAGVRDVQFASVNNPDLILLWERWMHPRPRPDLEA